MASDSIIFLRGEGGAVLKFGLPLSPDIQKRLTKGYLTQVNEDGSDYVQPAAEEPTSEDSGSPNEGESEVPAPVVVPTEPPAKNAAKAEWVGYAVRHGGMTPDDADAMTVADLREKFGHKE